MLYNGCMIHHVSNRPSLLACNSVSWASSITDQHLDDEKNRRQSFGNSCLCDASLGSISLPSLTIRWAWTGSQHWHQPGQNQPHAPFTDWRKDFHQYNQGQQQRNKEEGTSTGGWLLYYAPGGLSCGPCLHLHTQQHVRCLQAITYNARIWAMSRNLA